MDVHYREFVIEQIDKTKTFQDIFEKSVQVNVTKGRVFKMTKSFAKRRGRTK